MFYQEVFDWILLIVRWVHITVAVTWIGTSIFFMWLDRSFEKTDSKHPGHVGELWMVHGGGFYRVEKMLMGPTAVPETLHWFKWESYWTWISGFVLLLLTYYTGGGTYLLDPSVAALSSHQAMGIGLSSIFISWIVYDQLWESSLTRSIPVVGHLGTIAWFLIVTVFLCKTLAGRAAYIHIGAMLGTWMAANVFMRIIPRQLKMVEASKNGTPVNQQWAQNAKNRSTHNTYFTLPVIFIMLSNHFPVTYGSEYNWLCLILMTISGGLIRQFFVIRQQKKSQALACLYFGIVFLILSAVVTNEADPWEGYSQKNLKTKKVKDLKRHDHHQKTPIPSQEKKLVKGRISGVMKFEGEVPLGKKLRLPAACAKQWDGPIFSDELAVDEGKLKNVLVYISKGVPLDELYSVPNETVEIDQKGCIYFPRVSASRVGQSVTFINSDPIFHNVKGKAKQNSGFNLIMPRLGQRITKTFDRPELLIQTSCSVHPWMKSYIAVFDHPYFDVSSSDGKFVIENLPAGDYQIEFWHETLGSQYREIKIEEGKSNLTIDVTWKNKE